MVEPLGRVNLFVGENNCGKTSILEAAELLATGGDYPDFFKGSMRRGEIMVSKNGDQETEFDPCCLFHGRLLELGSRFTIEGGNIEPVELSCEIVAFNKETVDQLDLFHGELQSGAQIALSLKHTNLTRDRVLPLSKTGGLPRWVDRSLIRMLKDVESSVKVPVNYLSPESLKYTDISELWDEIALTPEEPKVTEAIRILDPNVDRIAFLSQSAFPHDLSRGGVVVKLKSVDKRLPLGNLGDGVKRLMSLSLSIIRSSGGFALIDEIDTGLHYSTMTKMWRMVIETAKRLDVQVFATTHSQDCVRSLAWLQDSHPELGAEVRLHRIEPGADRTVSYTAKELVIAAREHIEVR